MILILLILFLISLVPENIGFNFAFELRALVFAVGVAALICSLIVRSGVQECWSDSPSISCHPSLLSKGIKFTSLDVAYIAVTILTIISFMTKAGSINAFHLVFVQVGMFVVYFVIRFANLDEILLQSKIIYIIIGIGYVVAIIGLVQFAMGKPLVSTFGRTSFLGCFLAMNAVISFGLVLATRNVPLESNRYSAPACAGRYRVFGIQLLKLLSWAAFVVIFGVTILTKSRTAMIALAIVLPLIIIATKSQRHKEKSNDCQKPKTKLYKKIRRVLFSCLGVLVALFFIFNIGKAVYKIRPMSAAGRTLIWKVSAEMFKKNPITGVGFGNFANSYNLYQAEYFVSGKGSVINKMTAGQVRHAYNWYLEAAAEFGVFGLVVFGIFWWLILVEIFKTFKPHKGHKNTKVDYLNIGMSGAVLCFMIMSFFQFPRKIIPTYLMFNFALAWIVTANEKLATKSPRLEEEINKKV